jgi:nucleolar protein 14
MAPSQLKRLKASLREHGIVGPQKSKQQKKQASKNGISKEKKMQRSAALQGIRDQFNPFEAKPARSSKYEFVNSDRKATSAIVRPGVTKGLGEEIVRSSMARLDCSG